MDIRILGPLRVTHDGEDLALGGPKQRAVLAALVLGYPEVVRLDRIVDSLWPHEPPKTAVRTVQGYISNLRKVLGVGNASIERIGNGYALRVDATSIDAKRFEVAVENRRELLDRHPEEAMSRLQTALKLWVGDPLGDLDLGGHARPEVSRLEELHAIAHEARVDAMLQLGRHAEVIGELRGLVAEHPYRERFREQLMRALHSAGRRADALRVYRQGRERFVEELGIEPRKTLRRLEQAILREDPSLGERKPQRVVMGDVPVPETSFIGRQQELREIRAALSRARHVTLTGPGGCGKTRLAIEVADSLEGEMPDGIWFVDLARIREPSLVPAAIAATFDLREGPDRQPQDVLGSHLRDREALVVLDNCEHVVEACAALVVSLLRTCANVRFLATSQETLNVAGEVCWPVPNLEVPDEDAPLDVVARSDSVQLFMQRAREVGTALDDADIAIAADICRKLDGIPLAVELAASRLRILSPGEILAGLDDRFLLLTGGKRSALTRHRTLRATVEWSVGLLEDEDQRLFERLAVFEGRFTLGDVTRMCSMGHDKAVHDRVDRLLKKSLIVRAENRGGRACYRMLQTLRAYGRAELAQGDELDTMYDNHAQAFLEVVTRESSRTFGHEREDALTRMEVAREDATRALDRARERSDTGTARGLLLGLAPLWEARHAVQEARHQFRTFLAETSSATEDPYVLWWAAYFAILSEQFEHAEEICLRGLRASEDVADESIRARLLTELAESVRYTRNDPSRSRELCEAALKLWRETPDPWFEAHTWRVLTLTSWDRGDLDAASEYAIRSGQLWEGCGSGEGVAGAQAMLAGIAHDRGDHDDAECRYRQALRGFREVGERWGEAHVLHRLASLAVTRQEPEAARSLAEESLVRHEAIGNRRGIAFALLVLADVEATTGNFEVADQFARLSAERFRDENFTGDLGPALRRVAWSEMRKGNFDAARRLCEEALEPYRTSGNRREAAETFHVLGRALLCMGRNEEAHAALRESLDLFQERRDERGCARALFALAEAHLAEERLAEARACFTEARPLLGPDEMSVLERRDYEQLAEALSQTADMDRTSSAG